MPVSARPQRLLLGAHGNRWLRLGFLAVICLLGNSYVTVHAHNDVDKSRPNLLLILTEDQGWGTLGCYGGKKVPTPNLDRLAEEGARFTDGYITSQCTPTRATLLRGLYTERHGLSHVIPWYGYAQARMTEPMFSQNFSREQHTLAKGLREAGYRTAIVGRWHLRANADGIYTGLHPHAASHYGFAHASPILDKKHFDSGADRGVEELTNQALAFISESKGQPWFCFLSHHLIHGKVVAADAITACYRQQGSGDEGPDCAIYLAGLECIDRRIGRLRRGLEELGQADETLILFLSENGGIDERFHFKEMSSGAFAAQIQNLSNSELPDSEPEGRGEPPQSGIHSPPTSSPFPVDLVEYDNASLRAGAPKRDPHARLESASRGSYGGWATLREVL